MGFGVAGAQMQGQSRDLVSRHNPYLTPMKPTHTTPPTGPLSRQQYGRLLVAFSLASERAAKTYAENRKAQAEFVAAREAVASARAPL